MMRAVPRSTRADLEMRGELPATLQAAEEFIGDFRRQSQTRLSPEDYFTAELLMREALTNAVVHGSHADPDQRVSCWWRLKDARLLIAVQDDGCGFDWRAAWNNQAASPDCSGRGIEILRKYSSRVRFNGRGNAVIIVKRFVEEKQP
jgi:serine/threonine-protein kinase RsbW